MAETQSLTLEDLAELVPAGTRLLGLDLGTKTIGLALSDTSLSVATPHDTIQRKKFTKDVNLLMEHIEKHDVSALIIGLPLNLDGTEGPRSQATRAFVRNLAQHTDLPVVYWDERLSTVAAERTLLEADTSRKRRAEVIDKMAAAFILQGALDRLTNIAAAKQT
ncbi:MAG: Holliday junction resolvase RuvX [Hyphomicrobiaceae bacterium]|nr:Holliday junction resolvase RuvX [Hyphomicrobiaceae bacterium]